MSGRLITKEQFGPENATMNVAAVDAANGEVLGHARLPGSKQYLAVTAEEASRRAGATRTGIPRIAAHCQLPSLRDLRYPYLRTILLMGQGIVERPTWKLQTAQTG